MKVEQGIGCSIHVSFNTDFYFYWDLVKGAYTDYQTFVFLAPLC